MWSLSLALSCCRELEREARAWTAFEVSEIFIAWIFMGSSVDFRRDFFGLILVNLFLSFPVACGATWTHSG